MEAFALQGARHDSLRKGAARDLLRYAHPRVEVVTEPRITKARAWRLVACFVLLLTAFLTRDFWIPSIGWSLVCDEETAPSDAIFVENFDPSYLLFERAADLQQTGLAARVLVPAQVSDRDSELTNPVSRGIAELMGRLARVQNPEIIAIREVEPYSLNAAYQLRTFLTKEHLGSVVVVVPAFRSRRSSLVYQAVLRPAGIQVHCLPVFGNHTPENWTTTWHGIQTVIEQLVKLQFYRFWVLLGPGAGTGGRDLPRQGITRVPHGE
jgi:hypothetical protein